MIFIACTSDCVYQSDGECRLERAVSAGQNSKDGCAYYIKKSVENQSSTREIT